MSCKLLFVLAVIVGLASINGSGRALGAAGDQPVPAGFDFASGLTSYDQAYQKARRVIASDVKDGKFLAGANWAQVWTRDTSYSVDMACALLHPDVSKKTLLGLTQSGARASGSAGTRTSAAILPVGRT